MWKDHCDDMMNSKNSNTDKVAGQPGVVLMREYIRGLHMEMTGRSLYSNYTYSEYIGQYIGLCPFLSFATDFSFSLPISYLHYNRCIIVSNVNGLRKTAHFYLHTFEWHRDRYHIFP